MLALILTHLPLWYSVKHYLTNSKWSPFRRSTSHKSGHNVCDSSGLDYHVVAVEATISRLIWLYADIGRMKAQVHRLGECVTHCENKLGIATAPRHRVRMVFVSVRNLIGRTEADAQTLFSCSLHHRWVCCFVVSFVYLVVLFIYLLYVSFPRPSTRLVGVVFYHFSWFMFRISHFAISSYQCGSVGDLRFFPSYGQWRSSLVCVRGASDDWC